MTALKSNMVVIKRARLSFPVLFTPQEFNTGDGKPRWSCALLVAKNDPQVELITAAIDGAGEEAWGDKWLDPGTRRSVKINGFRDGDDKAFDGYAGHHFLSANRSFKQGAPDVVGYYKEALTEADGKPYAGCYVNAFVEFYGMDTYGKAINCTLNKVQFAGDGEPFSGSSSSIDPFDVIEDDDPFDAI
jgi:hypothetical protein